MRRSSLRVKISAIAFAALSGAVPPCSKAATDPRAVPGTEAHVYRHLSPIPVRLYVFKPQGWKSGDCRPALIWFFGSGGSPRNSAAWAAWAAGLGFVGVAPDYRVSARFHMTSLESVADARAALRWVEDHAAELGVDSHRIVTGGNSAGGFLALWTAISHAPPGSAEDESPTIKPAAMILTSPMTVAPPERFGDDARALSPLHQLDDQMPALLVFHGNADKGASYANSVALCARFAATGNVSRLITIPGGSHNYAGDNPAWWPRTLAIGLDFLKKQGLIPN